MAINTVINTNMMALTAHRNLGTVGNRQNKANQRLSSGKKINSAADDAAGLAISEKMKAQIRGLDMASKNSEDAISLIQTAEGSLTEVNNMLTRIRELTVQAANDTNQQSDRVKIAEEVATLLTEIDSISNRTEFNEKKLNDGSFKDGHFQIGANGGQKLELGIGNMSVFGIGADELMEAFGIEKDVDLNIKASKPGVVSGGEQASAKVEFKGNNTDEAKSAVVHLTIKNAVTGKSEKVSFSFADTQAIGSELQKNDGDQNVQLAKLLNSDSRFSDHFIANETKGDNLIISLKESGGSSFIEKIDVETFKDTDFAGGSAAQNNQSQKTTAQISSGSEYSLNLKNLADGDTVTIAGKTYTKVDDLANAKDKESSFKTADDLSALLAKEGIVTFKDGANPTDKATDESFGIRFVNGNESSLAGTYSVIAKDVSDKGKEYSEILDVIDESLKNVTTQRAKLGANQNRLEYTIKNLELSSENLNAARSRIEDTDMAKEMMNLTQANVLQQAATSILAQANQAPNNITQLLG